MNLAGFLLLSAQLMSAFTSNKSNKFFKHGYRYSNFLSMSSSPSTFNGYSRAEAKASAYEIAKTSYIKMPVIILVNPFLDANVGSVSRAMLNFGCSELRVVDPRCNITSDTAQSLSAGSYELLKNAQVFATLDEAVSDLQRVFATTVRLRFMNQLIYTPEAAAEVIITSPIYVESSVNETENDPPSPSLPPTVIPDINRNESVPQNQAIKCGIVFGRERDGLNNKEVSLCDSIITIPTFKHFASINLAQVVNIVGYELWKRKNELETNAPPPVWYVSYKLCLHDVLMFLYVFHFVCF